MDIINMLLFCLMSIIIGAVLMLLIQYYAFVKYCNLPENDERRKSFEEKYILPENLLSTMNSNDPENKNSVIAVNLVLQFLFFELRHSNKVRKWFHRKLSLELDELISKTTIGKLFDKLSIRDLDLGSQFPEIKNIKVHNVELHPDEGHIENLDVLLDLHYQGNFKLAIDADMVLGKKGFLSVKVKQCSGLARLQFTRMPYTHWSLSFVGDPQIELALESQFQGRQMQSNVTSLISNQIRKAIRRKHTLPNYKLRYKPFFQRIEDDPDCNDIIPNGTLQVTIRELTRLLTPEHLTHVYCVATLASIPWVVARQHDDQTLIISLDIEIHKAKNQQIGIVFRQNDQTVLVETVIPNTPAAKAKLNKGDTLISIEGKKVSHINHVAKIIKSLNRPIFMLRIERMVKGLIKNDAILEDFELNEDFDDSINISFSKLSDSVQIGLKSGRKNSVDKVTSSDSSHSNTPTNSPTRKIKSTERPSISRTNSENNSTNSILDGVSKIISTFDNKNSNVGNLDFCDSFQQHSTIDCDVNSFIRMYDLASFIMNENSQYLNLNVFGRCNEEIILLGYLNVPIKAVLYECGESSLGQYLKQYPLTPPDTPNLSTHALSSQSGFDQDLCYGDVLLSFSWNVNPNFADLPPKKSSRTGSTDKLEEDKSEAIVRKQHDFVRTHFHRATICDFCGKKIWLKDAVQCRDCAMCCHKKCCSKCRKLTNCGALETSGALQPEFKLTEPPSNENDDFEEIEDMRQTQNHDGHRQSFSDLLVQGIKRVNSANNLAIPGIGSSLGQSSRSLPPTPQHTPRKQSLANTSTNPFVIIINILEYFPDNISDLTREQITELVEPIIGWDSSDDLMALAKTSSRLLFADLEPNERVEKINILLSRLRLALDSETVDHANNEMLSRSPNADKSLSSSTQNLFVDSVRVPSDTTLLLQTKAPPSPTYITQSNTDLTRTKPQSPTEHEMTKRAFLLGQSEERVQALSIIMLHLCSGLQYAQGVAGQ